MTSRDTEHRCQPGLGRLLIAALGGAAAGALTVYLTAPRSGADTRGRIQAVADDARAAVERVPSALRKATEAAREAFNAALAEGDDSEAA
jgi:gas vesicle protein